MKKYSVMVAVLLMAGGCAHQGGMSGPESSSSSNYSRSNDANNRSATGQRQFGTSASNGGAIEAASLKDSTSTANPSDLSGARSDTSESTQPGASPADPYKSSSSSTTQSSTPESNSQNSGSARSAEKSTEANSPSISLPAEGGFGTSQIDRATLDSSSSQSGANPLNSNQATDKTSDPYHSSTDSSVSSQNDTSEGGPAATQSGARASSSYPTIIDAGSAATTSHQADTNDSGSLSDRALAAKIKSVLTRDTAGINGPTQSEVSRNVKISANNGRIILRGTVSAERDKKILETRVKEMEGVQSVDNQLAVSPSASPAARDSATGTPAPGSTSESKDSSSQIGITAEEKGVNNSSSDNNLPK